MNINKPRVSTRQRT